MFPILFASYMHDLSPFLIRFGGNFGIRWYGLAYVTAFFIGYWLMRWQARRGYSELTEQQAGDFITLGGMLGVLVGGRLGYLLFYGWSNFVNDPLSAFRVWDGGMASHGGILGLMIATFWYARCCKVAWTGLGDNLVVAAPLGLFCGRMANFINGELYGRATTVPWAVRFPSELLDDPAMAATAVGRSLAVGPQYDTVQAIEALPRDPAITRILTELLTPRHPSQLYAAALEGLVLFGLLLFVRVWCRPPRGLLTAVFFVGYALLRIGDEMFREPDAPMAGPFTRGQFLSLFMLAVGVVFLLFSLRNPRPAR